MPVLFPLGGPMAGSSGFGAPPWMPGQLPLPAAQPYSDSSIPVKAGPQPILFPLSGPLAGVNGLGVSPLRGLLPLPAAQPYSDSSIPVQPGPQPILFPLSGQLSGLNGLGVSPHRVQPPLPGAAPNLSNAVYQGTYVSDGDANGILNFAGQNFSTGGTWTNPVTALRIALTSNSSLLSGTLAALVDRAASDSYTQDIANSWYLFNLGLGRSLALTGWAYRSRSGVTTSTPLSMTLEGSNDNSNWVTLDTRSLSVTSPSQWFYFPAAIAAGYQYFRLRQPGLNSSGANHFSIGEFELYGQLTYPSYPSVPNSYVAAYIFDGDPNGVFNFAGQGFDPNGTWTNPKTAGRIAITSSSLLSGTLDAIADRASSDTYTTNSANSWYVFDLGSNQSLALKGWAYRSRSLVTSSTPTAMMLEGSNDNSTWTLIDTRSLSVASPDQWFYFGQNPGASYRYFRLTQTALTSSGDNYFTIGEFELYGTLTYVKAYNLVCVQGSYAENGQATNLLFGRRLIATQGSYAENGQAVALSKGKTMPITQGSYTETGQAGNLLFGRRLIATQGSYAENGQAVVLSKGKTMPVAQGSYNETGQAANMLFGRWLIAVQGSYSETGQAVALSKGKTMPVAQGSYAVNGQAANLLFGRRLIVAQGSYSETGQAVTFSRGKTLPVVQGSYLETGQAANLLFGRRLIVAQGGYTETGQAANLLFGRRLIFAPGSYSEIGQAVPLIYFTGTTYRLALSTGHYTLTGNVANLHGPPPVRVLVLIHPSLKVTLLQNVSTKTILTTNVSDRVSLQLAAPKV
jgi:hypothetical protein